MKTDYEVNLAQTVNLATDKQIEIQNFADLSSSLTKCEAYLNLIAKSIECTFSGSSIIVKSSADHSIDKIKIGPIQNPTSE